MSTVAFAVVAAVIVLASVQVVRSGNLIHAVLWLAVTLLGTAGLYALFDESFLAGVQVLTYVGGVVTLLIFGVMVTRRHESTHAPAEREGGDRAFIFAAALFVVLAVVLWRFGVPLTGAAPVASAKELARALVDDDLMAFEELSALLLAAIVGAVVLARRSDPAPQQASVEAPKGAEVRP